MNILTFDTRVPLKKQNNGKYKANYFIGDYGKVVIASIVNEIEAVIELNKQPDATWKPIKNRLGWFEKHVLIEELRFYN